MSEPLPLADVEAIIGLVGVREFENAPEYAKTALADWIRRLQGLSDDDLAQESRHWIYESALVASSSRNFDHIHCKATACFHESRRRLMAAGHDRRCLGTSIYSRAHAEVMRNEGHTPSPAGVCECEGVKAAPDNGEVSRG
jgi:hypothetical protein